MNILAMWKTGVGESFDSTAAEGLLTVGIPLTFCIYTHSDEHFMESFL